MARLLRGSRTISEGVSQTELDAVAAAALNPDGAQVFNDSGADVDFRIEGSGQANALFVNGANGNVGIGTASIDAQLEVESSNTDTHALQIVGSSLTTGNVAHFYSNSSDTSTRSLVKIRNDHASATGTKTLEVINDTTNVCCLLNQNNAATDGGILDMTFAQNAPNNDETGSGAFFLKMRDVSAVRGYIYSDGSHVDVSDRRLKENIVDVQLMLDKVNNLRIVNFNWIDGANKKLQMGAIAQEVEEVFPHLVSASPATDAVEEVRDENGKITTESEPAYEERFMLNKIGMIFPLVKAVQELSAKNDALEARVLALENA